MALSGISCLVDLERSSMRKRKRNHARVPKGVRAPYDSPAYHSTSHSSVGE